MKKKERQKTAEELALEAKLLQRESLVTELQQQLKALADQLAKEEGANQKVEKVVRELGEQLGEAQAKLDTALAAADVFEVAAKRVEGLIASLRQIVALPLGHPDGKHIAEQALQGEEPTP